jgi:hypothetical protein
MVGAHPTPVPDEAVRPVAALCTGALGPGTRVSAPGSDIAELFYLARRGNFLQLA